MKKEQKFKEALESVVSIMDGPVREAAKEAIRLADEINKITQDNNQATEELLTRDEACEYLKITSFRLLALENRGKVESYYKKSELSLIEDYLNELRQKNIQNNFK